MIWLIIMLSFDNNNVTQKPNQLIPIFAYTTELPEITTWSFV